MAWHISTALMTAYANSPSRAYTDMGVFHHEPEEHKAAGSLAVAVFVGVAFVAARNSERHKAGEELKG